MKGMISYVNKSCVTGKLLRQSLNIPRKKTQRRTTLDYFIRWGNAESFPVRARVELNTHQAVINASNKLRMLEMLHDAEVPVPSFSTNLEDLEGDCYIRDRRGVTRFGSDFNPASDLYFTKPIENKKREYRVHVFNNKVVAIYEKVPMTEETPKLFKSHNCNFRRSDPAISRCNQEGQQIAIDAVNALGLLFGGVDIIKTSDGKFFVCEVNSAPGLNSVSVQRFTELFKEYINDNLTSQS